VRYKYPSHHLFLDDKFDPMGGIEQVPLEARRAARVAAGHVFYGVHEHIPQECEYITILREPVARVVSMFHSMRRSPQTRMYDELVRTGMGLEEFARTVPDPGIDNEQTRLISGRGRGETLLQPSGGRVWVAPKLTREDLETAKRNLDRFLVVGLTERFDETFIMIRRALGWRLPMYETRNVGRTANGRRPEPPSEEAIELIRERNQFDLELYEYARGLFSAAVERQGASLRREVAAFKALNRIPNTLGPRIPRRLRHPLRSVLPR
jgi:hypothetical protein